MLMVGIESVVSSGVGGLPKLRGSFAEDSRELDEDWI